MRFLYAKIDRIMKNNASTRINKPNFYTLLGKTVFYIIFLLSPVIVLSQNYFEYNRFLTKVGLLEKPQSDEEIRRYYNSVIDYYDSAFFVVNNKGYIDDYTYVTKIAIKNNNFDKAEYFLIEAIKNGCKLDKIKKDLFALNKDFKKSINFDNASSFYKANRKKYKIKIDKKLKRSIYRIVIRDQRHRMFRYKPEKQNKKDSLNVVCLKNIYDKYGHMPSNADVKPIHLQLLQPTLLHQNPENACFFANKYLDLYRSGLYDNIEFIFEMLDQASYRYGIMYGYENDYFFMKENNPNIVNDIRMHKQSFGLIKIGVIEGNYWKHYFIPLEDKEYADSIRNIFGFCSIEELNLINENYIYDEELFIKKWGEFKLNNNK